MEPKLEEDLAAIAAIDAIPRILDLACRITGLGCAAVARVTEDRWIICAVKDQLSLGLQVGAELDVPRYGFQSFISVPVLRRGEPFGTLCAMDPRPIQPNRPEMEQMFQLFAELIGLHLDGGDQREVLRHDLRNELAAIDTSAQVLIAARNPDPSLVARMAQRIRESTARMARIIENM